MMIQYRCGCGSTNMIFACAFDSAFSLTGTKCSDFKCAVILDDIGRRKITGAALFCIRCKCDVAS